MIAEFHSGTTQFNELASLWWQGHKEGKSLSLDVLSSYCSVVNDESGPIAIQYIYPALGSSVAWIGFTVSNPANSKFKTGRALRLLFDCSEENIRQLGWRIVYTNFENSALHRLVAKRGYSGSNMIREYWRAL